jgi:hypothetical protein
MLKISTNPHEPGSGIGARRKNGDSVVLRGETISQLRTVRKVLIKMARHFQLPMAELGDFLGVDRINLTNRDLLDCLSTVPDPYAEVDFAAAIEAWRRDFKIGHRVLANDPSIEEIMIVWVIASQPNEPILGRRRATAWPNDLPKHGR